MVHLGDIKKIHDPPFVDCITFGSPCQDLSISGKRAGLSGERSGLFMEAVRIIKEMRCHSGGVYPTFAIWENVPGSFSSNSGKDFQAVLEELARIKEPEVSIPRPENGKWAKSGFIAGNGCSIAWRTIDAQFWGVPQRRRRIAVVVDFGGFRAGEILFERTGVSGNPEPSIPPWQGVARDPAHRTAGHDRAVEEPGAFTLKIRSGCEGGGKGPLAQTEKSATLSTLQDQTLFCLQGSLVDRTENSGPGGAGYRNDSKCFTLNTRDKHVVAIPINTQIATRHISLGERTGMGWGEDGDPAYTLQAGHEHAVCCLLNDQGGQSINVEDGVVSPTLRAESHAYEPIICAAFTAGQGAKANGIGWAEEQAPTLITSAMPTALCRMRGFGDYVPDKVASCVKASDCKNATDLIVESIDCRNHKSNGNLSGTIQAKENGGFSLNYINPVAIKILRWIVRRLTPTECERLQGFPDGWTDIGNWIDSKGKRHKAADSPRYKALGNSIALPQWWWITCKMAQYLPEHATLGSLFDGIGGFPLAWETLHGKGSAVWASEIEEFPIAVTKKWFPEEGEKSDEL